MKLKYILKMLVCLIVMTGIASADQYTLDCSKVTGATSDAKVTVTVTGNTIIFDVIPTTYSITKIGLPTGLTVITVTDNVQGSNWVDQGIKQNNNVGGGPYVSS